MKTAAEILQMVNKAIKDTAFERQPKSLYEPIEYVMALGGKRIRPVLLLMAYQLYRDDLDLVMSSALGIETYHNYTLLHDDVMDKAEMRRGQPTVHHVWDENAAILSGDTMIILAYRLISDVNERFLPRVLKLFSETALQICEGQQLDLDFEKRMDVCEEEYIEMIRLKTSVLLACSMALGAIQADAPATDVDCLYEFGVNVGLAFQLQDDLLDVYGDPATFGKKIGGDIVEGKKTFMLINALRSATPLQRAMLDRWLTTQTASNTAAAKIAAVTTLYDEIGVRAMAEARIQYYFEQAVACLDALALPAERKQPLRDFVLSLLGRQA